MAIGDIVGQPGRRAFSILARDLIRAHQVDWTVVNCENAAAGFGATPEVVTELFCSGAQCLTSGNHIWKHRTIYATLEAEPRLLRPANYPSGAPGRGFGVYDAPGGYVAVINLMGRHGFEGLDCPFRRFDEIHEEAAAASAVILVDFHAESTAEKAAFAHYVDGRASVVWGTHTHVQTADERILAGGTAFITDLGMTGPEDSVIGVAKEISIGRFRSALPARFDVAEGRALLCGVVAEVDGETGRAIRIRRIQERVECV